MASPTERAFPASANQRRMFVLQQLSPDGTEYNVPVAIRLRGALDVGRLEAALAALVARHPSLRTSFRIDADEVVQVVAEHVRVPLSLREARTRADIEEARKSFVRSFDLGCAPLFRACLVRLDEAEHVLLFDLHHIVCDGVSVDILQHELGLLYGGQALEELPGCYEDFTKWQRAFRATPEAAAQAGYWLKLLGGQRPSAALPADFPRQRAQSFEGDRVFLRPDTKLTEALRALAAKNRVSVYMLLLAAYDVFLSKYTGEEDVLVGTLVAGRRGERFRGIVGLFVNTLVLRSRPRGELPFTEYLKKVRDECLSAFENQDYQFEDLVERIAPPRDLGRNPLFDTMFSALSYDESVRSCGGVEISRYELGYDLSKFDLSVTVMEQGQELVLELEYRTALFTKPTIERMAGHFLNVVQAVTAYPRIRIADVELLAPEEVERLATPLAAPSRKMTASRSVVDLFEEHVKKDPSSPAVTFGQETVSYGELDRRARALAARLARHDLGAGKLVGVAATPSIDVLVGVLGILKAGAAYLPIAPATPLKRLETIVADSGMAALLVGAGDPPLDVAGPIAIPIDGGTEEASEPPSPRPPIAPGEPAYVIYTSGSTGTPKGVKVSHGALSNYISYAVRTYVGDEKLSFAMHSPLSVDLTVTSVFVPLVTGGRVVIYQSDDPAGLMRLLLGRNEVELVKLTPTHLSILAEVKEDLPSRLRTIIVGGEDLKVQLASKIHSGFAGQVRIYNEYGPTEATVGCTVHVFDPETDTGTSVPIGRALDQTRIFVLDRYRRPVPPGVTGELYIAGTCLADGYVNNPRLTDERFVVQRIGSRRIRMYRTGDLVRELPGGELDFLGRNDDQVKIRGFRIELGEIEAGLMRLPRVKEAVVTKRVDAAGDACLCAYVVADGEVRAGELRSALAEHLPPHMIPSWFVPLDRLPVARGGKLDKSALPEPNALAAESDRRREPPRSPAEAALVRIWEQVLGVHGIGIDDHFFDLGGQSLKATLMAARVNRELGAGLSLRDVFAHPTVRELSPLVGSGAGASVTIEPVAPQPHYPVSPAQKRLLILHQLAPGDVQYNMPWAIRIDGAFDGARWERAFCALVARHESLRTSFSLVDEELVQQVHPEVDFAFEAPATAGTLEEAIERFVRPFDLGRAPLIRARVVETGTPPVRTLLVDMHHVISDGLSAPILLEDLIALYQGKTLEEPALHYKDYAVWQRARAGTDALLSQAAYWTGLFADDVPVLDLPTDFARGAVQSFDGDLVRLRVAPETADRLRSIQRECGATTHMTLLAAYTIVLSKHTGQEDIVVGTPVAGRSHASLERVVGMFVNTLALRIRPVGSLRFRELLDEVRKSSLDAYANQDYPFDELVDRLSIERDRSRNPLFDTVFASLEGANRTFDLEGLRVELIDFEWKISKFDLTLLWAERDGAVDLEIEYCTKLFQRSTIERLGAHYLRLLDEIGRDPDQRIADLDPLTDAERRQILYELNRTEHAYPADRRIHEIVEEQVERRGDEIAVVYSETSLSYRELNRRANQVARALVSRGVAREEVVAILAGPSTEMIVGVLAILKAGGAYLPIDRDCPEDRGRTILSDSQARFVLLAGGAQWRDDAREVIDLGDPRLYAGDGSNLERPGSGRDLAYVIYTSGTTGVPKGVMIEHCSVNNLCTWHNDQLGVTASDRATKYARFSFDASVLEIFPYLQAGAALHVIEERLRLDLPLLNRYFEEHGITLAFLPTQVCELFAELPNRSLRVLLTGGDRLRRVPSRSYRIVNNYGPTESTVVTTSGAVSAEQERITIGRPIFNTRVYLLGSANQLVPIGVPGELCVAGVGLARAYLHSPEQTAARFVANPFEPNGRMYRTGDLARWLPDGSLEYIGRSDKQVKIRGCRTEPREIEVTILAHEAVRDAVVTVCEDSQHGKHLCAYVAWKSEPREAQVRAALGRQLPDYMVPSYLVTVDAIPMTATGKVDTRKLPKPDSAASPGQGHVAPRNDNEKRLAEIWCGVLERSQVGVHDNFFEIGGDSLRATLMLAKANKEFDATVVLGAVFDNPTIAGLALCFENVAPHGSMALAPIEARPSYPATPIQALLYSVCSAVNGVEYNLPMAYELEGDLDVARLESVFRRLIERHESLRTSFRMSERQVVLVVHPTVELAIDVRDECNEEELAETARDFIRPFDLGKAPLLRVALVPMGPRRHVLLLDVHHLVSDGTSMGILFREMAALYGGQELRPLTATYKDYAAWLGEYEQRKEVRALESYWKGVLADMPPQLRLDVDTPRRGRFTFSGGMIAFEARPEVHRALRALCAQHGVTLYMLLLAAYEVLLSKYSRQEDMIVAAPTSGRLIADVHDVVGMFVTTQIVRCQPRAGLRFDEFLAQVKTAVRNALDHQSYPLWEFFVSYSLQSNGKSPFSSVFVVQDERFTAVRMPGLKVRERDAGYRTAKFDLTMGAVERDGGLHFELEYSSDVYRRSTARRVSGHYMNLLEQIVADPTRELQRLELMSSAEKETMLRLSSGGTSAPAADESVLALWERQARQHPESLAVVCGKEGISHGELDRRANRLARRLVARGVAPGDRVAILVPPSIEMVAAVLGVWKAGAAYLPLSPGWPRKRVESAVARAGAKITLREDDLRELDAGPEESDDLGFAPAPDATAYVASVAERCVAIEHRSLLARCRWFIDRFAVTSADRSAKYGDLAASASIFEIFPILCAGGSISIVTGERIEELLCGESVTLAFMPAPRCERLAAAAKIPLRVLLTFGQNVRPSRTGAYELIRCAGVAENAEVTTCVAVRGDGRGANLGRPIPGAEAHIIGHDGGLQPIGVTGELCVGGAGLGREMGGDASVRFTANPHVAGTRMFRTGDSARWLPDGTLERTGRAAEVFIEGHRVSLPEIEQRLGSHSAVADAVVVFDEDDPRRPRLAAFLVPRAALPLLPQLLVADLASYLAEWLPVWMIPDTWMALAAIPRDADGRIRYASLALPERPALPDEATWAGAPGAAVAATTPTAEGVAALAGQVLKVPRVATDANLVDLGMTSFMATALAARLKEHYGRSPAVCQVLASPTALAISQRLGTAPHVSQEHPA